MDSKGATTKHGWMLVVEEIEGDGETMGMVCGVVIETTAAHRRQDGGTTRNREEESDRISHMSEGGKESKG